MHFGGVNAYYNNARFYDYQLGRFLQPDPIGFGGGMNMYGYVGGDPVNSTDPSGTCADIVLAHGGDCAESTARAWVAKQAAKGVNFADPKALVQDIVKLLRGELEFEQLAGNQIGREYWSDGVAAQGLGNRCPGQYNCDDYASSAYRHELAELFRNDIFGGAFEYSAAMSRLTRDEWGFTGKGNGTNFQLVGGYIHGGTNAIDARIIALRAAMGADIFFHIHPNTGPRDAPGLSHGISSIFGGGDLGVAYRNSMLVGAYAFKTGKAYWMDRRGLKP
jgi:hypothetical protein